MHGDASLSQMIFSRTNNDVTCIAGLSRLIKSSDPRVRMAAISSLAWVYDPAALSVLQGSLNDSDDWVRLHALWWIQTHTNVPSDLNYLPLAFANKLQVDSALAVAADDNWLIRAWVDPLPLPLDKERFIAVLPRIRELMREPQARRTAVTFVASGIRQHVSPFFQPPDRVPFELAFSTLDMTGADDHHALEITSFATSIGVGAAAWRTALKKESAPGGWEWVEPLVAHIAATRVTLHLDRADLTTIAAALDSQCPFPVFAARGPSSEPSPVAVDSLHIDDAPLADVLRDLELRRLGCAEVAWGVVRLSPRTGPLDADGRVDLSAWPPEAAPESAPRDVIVRALVQPALLDPVEMPLRAICTILSHASGVPIVCGDSVATYAVTRRFRTLPLGHVLQHLAADAGVDLVIATDRLELRARESDE